MAPPGKVAGRETGRFGPVDSINAHWAGTFKIIMDDDGWQRFRRLDPALLTSPATDGLETGPPWATVRERSAFSRVT